jgi:YafQ family addiction module toxin component
MTFKCAFTPELAKILHKLAQKDKVLAEAVMKKVSQIAEGDEVFLAHFKNLRGELSNYKRVHVGSFVLMFKLEDNVIIFDRLKHHDEAYA